MHPIIQTVCEYYGIATDELLSDSRKDCIVKARKTITTILRLNGYPFQAIGKILNRTHGCLIYYGKTRIPKRLQNLEVPAYQSTPVSRAKDKIMAMNIIYDPQLHGEGSTDEECYEDFDEPVYIRASLDSEGMARVQRNIQIINSKIQAF